MDREESCFFCGKSDARLIGWFVQAERRTTHMPCWTAAYRSESLASESSAPDLTAAADTRALR